MVKFAQNKAIAAALLTAGFLLFGGPSADRPVVSASVLLVPFVDCEIQCWDGPALGCEEGEHYAFDSNEFRNGMRYGGVHPGSCFSGSCETMHGEGLCDEWIAGEEELLTVASLESLRRAIHAQEASILQRMLVGYQKQLVFNADRQAIQVLGCAGLVKAHLPISLKTAQDLTELIEN